MSADNAKGNLKGMPIKKELITLNGNADGSVRLSSFSMPRDLTLGGASRGGRGGPSNKKVFIPNLNVTRNKNANVKTSKDTSTRGRNRPERGKSERGRGRGGAGRGGGNLIQTAGVFSEGAGALTIRKPSSSGSYGRSGDDGPTVMRKPTIVKKEGGMKIDIKADAEQIRELLGDSDDDDLGDAKFDPDWIPIKLSEDGPDVTTPKQVPIPAVSRIHGVTGMPRYPKSVDDLLTDAQPQLFMMQLPDTLPCEDVDDSPENQPRTSKEQSPQPEPVQKKNPLKEMAEGQIGKIVRYKSGKVKLVLGESHFDLTMGIETGFLQDLMSISTNREERSGNMINLGPIQAKLTATPDWEYLLRQK